jgi:hypothetical protein
MPAESPVWILDADWAEGVSFASGSLPASAEIEVRVEAGDEFDISIDNVESA